MESTIMIALIGILFIAVGVLFFRNRKQAEITAFQALEKILKGSIYAPVEKLQQSIREVYPSGYDIMDIVRAHSLLAPGDLEVVKTVYGPNFYYEKFMEEIRNFADHIVPIKFIVDEDDVELFGALRCTKGTKSFYVTFRAREIYVEIESVPKEYQKYVRVTSDGKSSQLHIISQVVFSYGKTGYEVKEDFINQLLAVSEITVDLFPIKFSPKGRISRLVYDPDTATLHLKQISIDPTRGYLDILGDRKLNLVYHGEDFPMTQDKALEIIADVAIAEEHATVTIEGLPGSGKTSFMGFLQKRLAGHPNIDNIIYGNGQDLKMFIGTPGRYLQNMWTNQVEAAVEEGEIPKLQVLIFDDAAGILEDPEMSQDLASLMDGQLKNMTNIVCVFLVNRELRKIPADLRRAGRMSVILEFPKLTGNEAASLATKLESTLVPPRHIDVTKVAPNKEATVAEVFDLVTMEQVDNLRKALEETKPETATTTQKKIRGKN